MPLPEGKDIIKWRNQLRHRNMNFYTTADQIILHAMPSKKMILSEDIPGEKKTQFIFDGTLQEAIPFAAGFIHSNLMNQATIWFSLKFRNEELNKIHEAQLWLIECRRRMLLAMSQSNYYSAGLEWIQDWLAFGTGGKLIEQVPRTRKGLAHLMTTAMPYGSYEIAEGPDGKIDTCIRSLTQEARRVVQKFGDKVPEELKQLAKEKPYEDIRIVHAIMPNDDFNRSKTLRTSQNKAWASLWLLEKDGTVLQRSGYDVFPASFARFNVIAGEILGRGDGELALPNAQTLNLAMSKEFREWDKTLDPPTKERQGNVVGTLSHLPGSRNVMRDINQFSYMDLEMRNGNRLHEFQVNDLRTQIRQIFQIDAIKELIGRTSPDPQKTAYEVATIVKILRQLMGPVGGKLESEGLQTDIEIVFGIMEKAGALPQAPGAVAQAMSPIDIVFEGALAKAQREEEAQQMLQYLNDLALLAQGFDPNIPVIIDSEKWARRMAELRGVQENLHGKDDYDQNRNLMQQNQQLQAQLAQMEQASKAVGNIAPALQAMNGGKKAA